MARLEVINGEEFKMFKNWDLKDLKFYYLDNVDSDEFPTFIHWMRYLRQTGQY